VTPRVFLAVVVITSRTTPGQRHRRARCVDRVRL